MDGTIIGQGSFIAPATITNQYIVIPSGADWMRVTNYTQQGTVGGAAAAGNEFYWQRGMAPGTGSVKYYSNGSAVLNGDTLATGGFTLYDPSGQTPGALPLLGPAIACTVVSNATRPVVTTASTAGLAVGTVVRLSNNGGAADSIYGIDAVVGTVTNGTTFTLLVASNALATANGQAGGASFYRVVNYSPLYYPRTRTITNITSASNAQVSTSIAHGLTPGQEVRFNIPSVSGMIQLNPQPLNNYYPTSSSVAAIVQTVVDAYNFTINIDTTGYTAFTFPTYLQQPSSFPEVTPFGEDTATALVNTGSQVPGTPGSQIFNTNTGILADSTVNTGYLGMILGVGGQGTVVISSATTAITGPAGTTAADVIYWVAGKSTYGGQ